MSLTAYCHWEVDPATGNDNNACGFDPSQTAGMNTDGAATSANTSAPVFTSASYNFQSSDIGASLFIASGTNWIPGWYKIASVATNAATLTATAGSGTLLGFNFSPTIANGIAITSSPTGATWSIDYSQQASAQVTFTDLVIGVTNTQLTSVGNPFGKQYVGNIINITSGSGFTVSPTSRYCILSVSTITATMDRAVGTSASTAGHGTLGGAGATIANLCTSSSTSTTVVIGNVMWMTGTLTVSAQQNFTTTTSSGIRFSLRGYSSTRGDNGKSTITTSTNTISLLNIVTSIGMEIRNLILSTTAGTPGMGIVCFNNNVEQLTIQDCTLIGFNIAVNGNNGAASSVFYGLYIIETEIKSCTSHGIQNAGSTFIYGCYVHNNTGDGANTNASSTGMLHAYRTVFANNGTNGIYDDASSSTRSVSIESCVFYDNTNDGLKLAFTSAQGAILLNNIFYGNGNVHFEIASIQAASCPCTQLVQRNNAFGSGTPRNTGAPADPTDITLTANPFNSPSTGDFSLNSTSGGGALLKAAGWESSIV